MCVFVRSVRCIIIFTVNIIMQMKMFYQVENCQSVKKYIVANMNTQNRKLSKEKYSYICVIYS